MPRIPGSRPASACTASVASRTSPTTMTSPSRVGLERSSSSLADRWWKAPTTWLSGSSAAACWATLPSSTSSTKAPSSSNPMGTTQSTTILPARGVASSASVAACPANGTATTTRSAAPATSTLDPPCTDTGTPPEALSARFATSAATSAARSASREPISTRCPAAAGRTASPRPCGPVPPSTPTTSSSTARSVTSPPSAHRPTRRRQHDHAGATQGARSEGRDVSGLRPRRGPQRSASPRAQRPTAGRARPPRGWRTDPGGAARRSRRGSRPCGASGRRTIAAAPWATSSCALVLRANVRPPTFPPRAAVVTGCRAPLGDRPDACHHGAELPRTAGRGASCCDVRPSAAPHQQRHRPALGAGAPPRCRSARHGPVPGRGLFIGGLAGTTRLLADGLVREGAARWEYGGVMGLCLAASVLLAVRRKVGRDEAFGLVLLGNLVYVAVVLALDDPGRYASPLILLFPCFVGAWFLGPWQLAANMALTTAACTAGLWPGHVSAAGLALEVVVNAGTLNACALAIFLIRRRVARLLVATEMLSNLDPLTGLANRRYLVQQAPRMWRQARRDGIRVAAMVLDLDHFKRLNDAHGHAAGDAVLQAVSHALAATVRPADVLARTGGEELVVLGLVSDPDEARRLAERLRAAVAGSRTERGHRVTASLGVALTRPNDGEDPADALWRLVDRADVAMYEAKQQRRDRVAASWAPRARIPAGNENRAVPGPSATDGT